MERSLKVAFPGGFLVNFRIAAKAFWMPLLCLAWVVLVSRIFVGAEAIPILLASMGAAAVIMFSAPHSPMATYRAFLLGNLLSALVGVSYYQWLGGGILVGPLAVATAIAVMHLFKCAHPPGGATALVAVIGGEAIHALGYWYVLAPVALNISLFAGVVWWHRRGLVRVELKKKTEQNLRQLLSPKDGGTSPEVALGDVEHALKKSGLELDVGPKEVQRLLFQIQRERQLRVFGERSCGELMNPDHPSVEYGANLSEAWELMRDQSCDYVIVLDKVGRVDGQLQLERLIELADVLVGDEDFVSKMDKSLAPSGSLEVDRPEEVGLVMTSISTVLPEVSCLELFEKDAFKVAVIDEAGRYLGALDELAVS